MRLGSELGAALDRRGVRASTLRTQLTRLGAESQATTSRLRANLDYMTSLASETQGQLEGRIGMLQAGKEAEVARLRRQHSREMSALVDAFGARFAPSVRSRAISRARSAAALIGAPSHGQGAR